MLIQYGYNGYLSKNLQSVQAGQRMDGRQDADHEDDEYRRRHGEDKPVIKKALVELTVNRLSS